MSNEVSPSVEIETGQEVLTVVFSSDGSHLISGGYRGVHVWRVQDGIQIATMKARGVYCLAASKDANWIAAGTSMGKIFVWDAKKYKLLTVHECDPEPIAGVDFSPDSTRFIAASWNHTVTIREITADRKQLVKLRHNDWIKAARYSRHGDRIATATGGSVRVWDSNDGRLLANIDVKVVGLYNTGLLWLDDHLLVISDNKIKEFDATTGSTVSEWRVPETNNTSCIALPPQGKFITFSARNAIMFWQASTRFPHCIVRKHEDIDSIALSSDERRIAIVSRDGKIVLKSLTYLIENDSVAPSFLHPTFQEPELSIDNATLRLWKDGRLVDAEELLNAGIAASNTPNPHVLANRALIRTRLTRWDEAIVDADESIKIQPSVIGYIAKCVALVGKGKLQEGIRTCDIAFEHFHSTHVTSLLLIKAIVLFIAGEHEDAISRVNNLIETACFRSTLYVIKAYMHLLVGTSQMEDRNYHHAIQSFYCARSQLSDSISRPFLVISLITGWKFSDLRTMVQQRLCEAFYAAGRVDELSEAILETVNVSSEESEPATGWIIDFMQQWLSTPESTGNASSEVRDSSLYGPGNFISPTPLLGAWAKVKLKSSSWEEAISSACDFIQPRLAIYRVVCERLENIDNIAGAVLCFHRMKHELAQEIAERPPSWILAFESRCLWKLEDFGDIALNSHQYDEAISQYTIALSLNPTTSRNLFEKRSKAHAERGLWADALSDANEVIGLDSSSPLGYERMHAALLGARRFEDAIDTFETMLLKISESPDPDVRGRSRLYVTPTQMKEFIRTAVEEVISESPPVLINTKSGRLLDKSAQASSFELQPIFLELISSMTTNIDCARVQHEVAQYYRYAMFSHKWEDDEPLYDTVVNVVVYHLEASKTHNKLKQFCKIVREAGLHWAWSDTCCINRGNHFVLQEALVSMFRWYQGSAVTIVFLLGVPLHSQRGALARSIWNMRAWTLQEYHASRVVLFYTENWTPYMNLSIHNHKESPEVISEMEEATGVSAQALMSLCPGLDDIREKLRLASPRQTTRIEDAAYSLLGIFTVSLPVTYGEGDKALGRLLAQLLMSSGDTSILAWTGRSGSFNTCLPANIAVFKDPPTSHIPPATTRTEAVAAELDASSVTMTMVTELYNRLCDLPLPFFVAQRMRLPCLRFKLGPISVSVDGSERVFRAQTTMLGVVEIRTEEDLSRLGSLYLVHPWIDFLLARQPVGSAMEAQSVEDTVLGEWPSFSIASNAAPGTPATPQTRAERLTVRLGRSFWRRRIVSHQDTTSPFLQPPRMSSTRDAASLRAPSSLSPIVRQKQALRMIDRLRQPFGALLLTPTPQHVEGYRRVAAESPILVEVKEVTPTILDKLIRSVRTLDVL